MKECSLLNWFINNLPFELHLPGYNYCGPGTRLQKRLARGDKGINLLDEYCKEHDIAYNRCSSLESRLKADLKLMKMAKVRATAPDSSLSEKLAAHLVNKCMLAKVSSGAGLKKSNTNKKTKLVLPNNLKKHLKHIISHTKKRLSNIKPTCKKAAIDLAIAAAREIAPNSVKLPRVIPIPKTGGFLPLIPIFAGLSAVGSLAGGAAGIAKVIEEVKNAKKRLSELKRHNEKMESVCLGKGLQLKQHKNGLKICLSKKTKKN